VRAVQGVGGDGARQARPLPRRRRGQGQGGLRGAPAERTSSRTCRWPRTAQDGPRLGRGRSPYKRVARRSAGGALTAAVAAAQGATPVAAAQGATPVARLCVGQGAGEGGRAQESVRDAISRDFNLARCNFDD
jgi:hypothetical protein